MELRLFASISLLLALGMDRTPCKMIGAFARQIQSNDRSRLRVRQHRQSDQTGRWHGTAITADVGLAPQLSLFSALHDPVTGEVRIFVLTKPEKMCSSITFCRFTNTKGDVLDTPASMKFNGQPSPKELYHCVISCPLGAAHVEQEPAYDMITLHTQGTMIPKSETIRLDRIKVVEDEKKRGVGVCLEPLFNNAPQFSTWVEHWLQYKVDIIYAYVPLYGSQAEYEASGLTMQYERQLIFEHRRVTYVVYRPLPNDTRRSKNFAYTDCVFRGRQSLSFVAVNDVDEFLYFPQGPPFDLRHWLAVRTPEGSAGIQHQMYGMPSVHCHHKYVRAINAPVNASLDDMNGATYTSFTGYDIFDDHDLGKPKDSYVLPVGKSGWVRTKTIVRPQAIVMYHIHTEWIREPGWNASVLLSINEISHKHVRCSIGVDWGSGYEVRYNASSM